MKQLVLDIIPAPAPSLANFVTGRNVEALAVLQSFRSPQGGAATENPASLPAKVLYLWGVAGSGKTHLIHACLANGYNALGSASAPLSDASDVADAGSAYAIDAVNLLDDAAQHALFDLINRQQLAGGWVIATGNVAPRDLALRRDLASRLGSGLVFQLQPLTDAEKAEALRAHAATRSFPLREEVIAYLLRHGRRDMPSLIGILDELDRYSLESGREITLPMLKEVAQPSLV